ncbi:MAG: CHAD domain-containing protein [Nakamurella sp.]
MTHLPLRFGVDADTPLPELADLTPGGARWEQNAETVQTRHLDTSAHDLRRAGASLSRWSTGSAAGWRLDLPARPTRDVPDRARSSASTEVPPTLAAAVLGVRRGLDLVPVATVTVHRSVHRLLDAAGDLLLELADESVHTSSSTPDGALLAQWRRWVLAAAPDSPGPVAALTARLTATTGSRPETDSTDLEHAIGRLPSADPDTDGGDRAVRAPPGGTADCDTRKSAARKSSPGKRGTKPSEHFPDAGTVILAYLREQDDALIAGDLTMREGPRGIHPTRVATRRLRSTLRIFAPFVDADRAAAFDHELSWYAAVLGDVRDREVQRVRMRKLIDEIPDELVLGPVAQSIDAVLRSEEMLYRTRLAEVLDSERYLDLLRESQRWSTMPPFAAGAAQDAHVLGKRVRKAAAKLVTHLEAGLRHGGGDEELHRARKAGKRARYAAELAAPVLGERGSALVSRYQEVQDVLGDHQDGVVACALIRRLAAGTVGKRKENGFTYGLLYAREQERAIEGRERADALFAKLRD